MAMYVNGRLQTMMPANSISNIRYVEADDMVQLYYDGQWRDWKSGGMVYPVGTEIIFDYTGQVVDFVIPATGNWKLEVWGAAGGNAGSGPGKGGYSKGIATLQNGDEISVAVGGQGITGSAFQFYDGGFNGGGYARCHSNWENTVGSGGGATHIAMGNRGELKEYELHTTDLLIVAGGGGGGEHMNNAGVQNVKGGDGAGGNYSGLAGGNTSATGGGGGTQNAGGSGVVAGVFGCGGNADNTSYESYYVYSGGGGGYYGGGAGGGYYYGAGGGGGSGYIKSTLTDTDESTGVREGNGYAKLTFMGR